MLAYAWVPVAGFAVAFVLLLISPSDAVFESRWLLTALNFGVFMGAALIAAILAARGFIESGSSTLLLLGAGLLTFGLGMLAGAIFVAAHDVNAAVTAHNISALIAAAFHGTSASLIWRSPSFDRLRGHALGIVYVFAVAAVALVALAAWYGLLPPFFTAAGSTLVRDVVLAVATIIYLVSSTLFGLQGRRTGADFLRWYSYGLALIGIGVASVAMGPPGSAIGWVGRLAQAAGELYVLACLLSALFEMPATESASRVIGRSFRRMEEMLRESESRYRKLFTSLIDGFALHQIVVNGKGEPIDYIFVEVNEAFETLSGLRAENIIGRRVSEAIPGIEQEQARWIERYGKVALTGTPDRFEQYSDILKRWYSVSAYSPEPGYFVTVFDDVTERKLAEVERESYVARLVALLDLSTDVLSATDLRQLIQRVSDAARVLIGARLVVSGHDFRHGAFRVLVTSRAREAQCRADEAIAAVERPTVFEALVDGASMRASHEQALERFGLGSGGDSECCSGLMAARVTRRDGRPVGVIAVMDKAAGEFTSEDELLLRQLASITSLGLEHLTAFQRERTIADTLQQAILSPPEETAGIQVGYLYRAASRSANVGGDFYDVFRLTDETVGILIGDVSGKGLQAARLTSLVKDGIRAYAYQSADPGYTVTHVNMLVKRATSVESYATLFFGVLDVSTGNLRYCSAGHTPAIIMHGDGSSSLLDPCGGLVGAFSAMRFESDEVTLAVDDRLLLYTDGLVEARRQKEFYGEERLLRALSSLDVPVTEVPDRLLGDVLKFAGGELRDDAAILCVARRPASESLEPEPDLAAKTS